MNKIFFKAGALALCLSLCAFPTACSSDTPDEPDPKPNPTPEPEPEPEPEPVMGDEAILSYFRASLKGESLPTLSGGPEVTADSYSGVRDHLWELWARANKETETLSLPAPGDMYAEYFDYNYSPNGSWPIVGGNLNFKYSYFGKKPSGGWPLILFLHGSGSDSKEEFEITFDWCEYFEEVEDPQMPTLYFIPQSPAGGTGCRWYQPSRQQAWERMLRLAYLSGDVDPDRIYMAGISEGAYGTERLCAFYADYLAGAGPIAGGEPLVNCAIENNANIFYCQVTGSEDTDYGRAAIVTKKKEEWARLQTAHPEYYQSRIELKPGAEHGFYYNEANVTTDLKKHSRNPWPKYVHWENYALGNVNDESYECRKGFYNLYVIEGQNGRTDGAVRDAYEMTVEGNNIDLKVMSVTVEAADFDQESGINIGAGKTYADATKGKVRIYLNDKLVDLSKPVTVTVNGKKKFEGTVELDGAAMIESLALFFDPQRIFPASVDVSVE